MEAKHQRLKLSQDKHYTRYDVHGALEEISRECMPMSGTDEYLQLTNGKEVANG